MNKKMKSRQSAKNGKSNSGRSKNEDFRISESFKKQLLGFLLMLFAVLLFISIVTYSSQDQSNLSKIKSPLDFLTQLSRKETEPVKYSNYLGLSGGFISDLFVLKFIGYFSVSVPLIMALFGFLLVRKKIITKGITFSSYLFLLSILFASTAGLIKKIADSKGDTLTGNIGIFIGSFLHNFLGGIGAGAVLILSIIAIIFLLVDNNIFKTFARLQLLWEKFKDLFKKEKSELIEKEEIKKQKKEEKRIQKEEKLLEGNSMQDALKREREKILKMKKGKKSVDDPEEEIISETEINRPKTITTVQAKQEKQIKEIPLEELKIKTPKKESASETDINPENDNEVSAIGSLDEDDFIEEKLENYKKPGLDLLDEPSKEEAELISDEELKLNGLLLQEKLLKFGIKIDKVFATPGPVVTLYELIPAADVKLSKIESLQDDIALAMKAKGIRMIIPIPGKGTVGVEIPNRKAQIVRIKSILSSQKYHDTKGSLAVAFGKTIDGDVYIDNLSKMPHVLIAGATGSGKSVGINTIIASLLYRLHPSDLKFIMIDPKKIELNLYTKLKKHFLATSTDVNESIVTSSQNAVSILKSVELEMEQRYDKLANAGVRDIDVYNTRYDEGKLKNTVAIRHRKMPYIVVIIDELADLMITAKRDIEEPIARIAQMARAVGIHLVLATQRPSVDVITGVIKANFPVRIAYQVASKIDSRTILDMGGADALLRNGDMLFLSSSHPKPIRIQNAYISTEECEKIVEFIGAQQGFTKPYLLPSLLDKRLAGAAYSDDRDELFEDAARLIIKIQQCTTSTLQRRMRLGYARAARIVDQLEAAGIVGESQGSRPREILITEDDLINYL